MACWEAHKSTCYKILCNIWCIFYSDMVLEPLFIGLCMKSCAILLRKMSLSMLNFLWNRCIGDPQTQEWRRWDWEGKMLKNGCHVAYSLRIWGCGFVGMNITHGKKPEVFMNTVCCIIGLETSNKILSAIFARICSCEWVFFCFVSYAEGWWLHPFILRLMHNVCMYKYRVDRIKNEIEMIWE